MDAFVLIRLAEIIEKETEAYYKMDPDPFDDRHPGKPFFAKKCSSLPLFILNIVYMLLLSLLLALVILCGLSIIFVLLATCLIVMHASFFNVHSTVNMYYFKHSNYYLFDAAINSLRWTLRDLMN